MSGNRERQACMIFPSEAASTQAALALADPPRARQRPKARRQPHVGSGKRMAGKQQELGACAEQHLDVETVVCRLLAEESDTDDRKAETRAETVTAQMPLPFLMYPDLGAFAGQFAASFDAIGESALIFDSTGRIVQANATDRLMFGYDASPGRYTTTVHERLRLLVPRDEHGQLIGDERSPFARILRGERLGSHDAVHAIVRAADGRDVGVQMSGAPVVDVTGKIIGGVIVTRDVTDHWSHERALLAANRRMEETLAVVAHDLRTPITSSRGYVQLAAMRLNKLAADVTKHTPTLLSSIEQLQQNLEEAEQSTRRLGRLVDRLLDVARIKTDKLELQLDVVALAEIIRTKVREQQIATPARTIRCKLSRPNRPVLTVADADRIGQVILNYLSNALKYSPEDSVVEIALKVSRGQARVSVHDEGSGIPAIDQARIWSRFVRLDSTQQRGAATGLGLGLYISRAIVEAHGGRVGLESVKGRGSTFWFSLPVVRPAE